MRITAEIDRKAGSDEDSGDGDDTRDDRRLVADNRAAQELGARIGIGADQPSVTVGTQLSGQLAGIPIPKAWSFLTALSQMATSSGGTGAGASRAEGMGSGEPSAARML